MATETATRRKKKITRYPLTPCPYCLKGIDAATPVDDDAAVPGPGDVTLCFECGEWCVFAEGMTLRKPTDEELTEIALARPFQIAREAWVDAKEAKTSADRLHADIKTVMRIIKALRSNDNDRLTVLGLTLVTVCKAKGIPAAVALANIEGMFDEWEP
jgi:hypothetical protein